MRIVGSKGPVFEIPAVINKSIGSITDKQLQGNFSLFFFYSLDFGAVCSSEMLELQKKLPELEKRNVKLMGISVDSVYTHLSWINASASQGEAQGITYPLISDMSNVLSLFFNVLDPAEGICLRATFILDKDYIIQYGSVNAHGFGRDIDELIRTIDTIQFSQTYGQMCPANWRPGDKTTKDIIKINVSEIK